MAGHMEEDWGRAVVPEVGSAKLPQVSDEADARGDSLGGVEYHDHLGLAVATSKASLRGPRS